MFDLVPNPQVTKEEIETPKDEGEKVDSTNTDTTTARRLLVGFGSIGDDTSKYCKLHQKFKDIEIHCLLLNNVSNIGFELLFFLLMKILIRLIMVCTGKSAAKERGELVYNKGYSESSNSLQQQNYGNSNYDDSTNFALKNQEDSFTDTKSSKSKMG